MFIIRIIAIVCIIGLSASQSYACTDSDRNLTCEGVKSEKVCGVSNCQINGKNGVCYKDYTSQCLACLNKDVYKVLFEVCPAPSFPYYCTSEDRNKECPQTDTTIKQTGFCGLYNSSIKCIKAPCGEDFSSTCEACKNSNVDQVLNNSCSSSSSTTNNIISCVDKDRSATCDNTSKDTSCGYRDSSNCGTNCIDEFFSPCHACLKSDIISVVKGSCPVDMCLAQDRGSICTADYSPVCGKSLKGYKNFSNKCHACSNSEIITTKSGVCSDTELNNPQGAQFISCSGKSRNAICSMEYKGVCALTLEGCASSKCMFNTGTDCQACSNSSVIGYYDTECQKLFSYYSQDSISDQNSVNYQSDSTTTGSKYICKDSDRTGMCTKDYRGVCGYKNEQTCIDNCKIDSANFCTACYDKEVIYVLEGNCPYSSKAILEKAALNKEETNSTPIQYSSYQGILCSDSDKSANCAGSGYGSVCAYKACPSGACPENQNKCLACIDSKTQFYVNTNCTNIDPKLLQIPCSASQKASNCTESMINSKVCGIYDSSSKLCLENSCKADFSSSCLACKNSDIISYSIGVCSSANNLVSIAILMILLISLVML